MLTAGRLSSFPREADLWVQALLVRGRAGGPQAGGEGPGDVSATSYCGRLGDWLLRSTLTRLQGWALLGLSDGPLLLHSTPHLILVSGLPTP